MGRVYELLSIVIGYIYGRSPPPRSWSVSPYLLTSKTPSRSSAELRFEIARDRRNERMDWGCVVALTIIGQEVAWNGGKIAKLPKAMSQDCEQKGSFCLQITISKHYLVIPTTTAPLVTKVQNVISRKAQPAFSPGVQKARFKARYKVHREKWSPNLVNQTNLAKKPKAKDMKAKRARKSLVSQPSPLYLLHPKAPSPKRWEINREPLKS